MVCLDSPVPQRLKSICWFIYSLITARRAFRVTVMTLDTSVHENRYQRALLRVWLKLGNSN